MEQEFNALLKKLEEKTTIMLFLLQDNLGAGLFQAST